MNRPQNQDWLPQGLELGWTEFLWRIPNDGPRFREIQEEYSAKLATPIQKQIERTVTSKRGYIGRNVGIFPELIWTEAHLQTILLNMENSDERARYNI